MLKYSWSVLTTIICVMDMLSSSIYTVQCRTVFFFSFAQLWSCSFSVSLPLFVLD